MSVGEYLCVLIKASCTFLHFESASGVFREGLWLLELHGWGRCVGGWGEDFPALHYVNSVYVVH